MNYTNTEKTSLEREKCERYLFFDIECSNGKDICEFGYVITDLNFNIISKKCIMINPTSEFRLSAKNCPPNIKLAYKPEEYFGQPEFPFFYEEIKSIIEFPRQKIFGHSMRNDAVFLRNACNKYGLKNINFSYCDTQIIYKNYASIKNDIGLDNLCKTLEVDSKISHKSDDDAESTMLCLKTMCSNSGENIDDFLKKFNPGISKVKNGQVTIYGQDKIKKKVENRKNNVIKYDNYRIFRCFVNNVKPKGKEKIERLNGKKISISLNYEYEHFVEMLKIIQLITDAGGKYNLRTSSNDIFVTYEKVNENGEKVICPRTKCISEANKKGENIEIISFEELLSILKTDEKKIENLPLPSFKGMKLKKRKNIKKQKK